MRDDAFSSAKVNASNVKKNPLHTSFFPRIFTLMCRRMRRYWCFAECVQYSSTLASSIFFVGIMEAVMLSWSPERHQQSGRSRGGGGGGVVDVWMNGWFSLLMQRWRKERLWAGKIWMDDDRRDAEMDEHERE